MDGENKVTTRSKTKEKENTYNFLATTPFLPAIKWKNSAQTPAQNIPAGFVKSFNKESGDHDCFDNAHQTTDNRKRKEKAWC